MKIMFDLKFLIRNGNTLNVLCAEQIYYLFYAPRFPLCIITLQTLVTLWIKSILFYSITIYPRSIIKRCINNYDTFWCSVFFFFVCFFSRPFFWLTQKRPGFQFIYLFTFFIIYLFFVFVDLVFTFYLLSK